MGTWLSPVNSTLTVRTAQLLKSLRHPPGSDKQQAGLN
jgi:hypothetical protein